MTWLCTLCRDRHLGPNCEEKSIRGIGPRRCGVCGDVQDAGQMHPINMTVEAIKKARLTEPIR